MPAVPMRPAVAPASFDADDLDFDHYLALHRSSPERAAKPEADFSELRQSMEAAAARMERRREERKQEELEGLRLAALETRRALEARSRSTTPLPAPSADPLANVHLPPLPEDPTLGAAASTEQPRAAAEAAWTGVAWPGTAPPDALTAPVEERALPAPPPAALPAAAPATPPAAAPPAAASPAAAPASVPAAPAAAALQAAAAAGLSISTAHVALLAAAQLGWRARRALSSRPAMDILQQLSDVRSMLLELGGGGGADSFAASMQGGLRSQVRKQVGDLVAIAGRPLPPPRAVRDRQPKAAQAKGKLGAQQPAAPPARAKAAAAPPKAEPRAAAPSAKATTENTPMNAPTEGEAAGVDASGARSFESWAQEAHKTRPSAKGSGAARARGNAARARATTSQPTAGTDLSEPPVAAEETSEDKLPAAPISTAYTSLLAETMAAPPTGSGAAAQKGAKPFLRRKTFNLQPQVLPDWSGVQARVGFAGGPSVPASAPAASEPPARRTSNAQPAATSAAGRRLSTASAKPRVGGASWDPSKRAAPGVGVGAESAGAEGGMRLGGCSVSQGNAHKRMVEQQRRSKRPAQPVAGASVGGGAVRPIASRPSSYASASYTAGERKSQPAPSQRATARAPSSRTFARAPTTASEADEYARCDDPSSGAASAASSPPLGLDVRYATGAALAAAEARFSAAEAAAIQQSFPVRGLSSCSFSEWEYLQSTSANGSPTGLADAFGVEYVDGSSDGGSDGYVDQHLAAGIAEAGDEEMLSPMLARTQAADAFGAAPGAAVPIFAVNLMGSPEGGAASSAAAEEAEAVPSPAVSPALPADAQSPPKEAEIASLDAAAPQPPAPARSPDGSGGRRVALASRPNGFTPEEEKHSGKSKAVSAANAAVRSAMGDDGRSPGSRLDATRADETQASTAWMEELRRAEKRATLPMTALLADGSALLGSQAWLSRPGGEQCSIVPKMELSPGTPALRPRVQPLVRSAPSPPLTNELEPLDELEALVEQPSPVREELGWADALGRQVEAPTMAPPPMAAPKVGGKRSAPSPPLEEEQGDWSGVGGPRAGEALDRGEKIELSPEQRNQQLAELLRAADLGGRGEETGLLQDLAQKLGLNGAEKW